MYLIEFAAIYMTQSESSVFGVLSLYSLWKTLPFRTGSMRSQLLPSSNERYTPERQFPAGFVNKARPLSGIFPP
jgi:hypothetical protein